MPAPIPHHRASGIHPGAFVQSETPSTEDVQDGVLWIDTSTEEPYALKVWDASSSVWRRTAGSLVGDCLVFPHGAAICDDLTRVLPSPLMTPQVQIVDDPDLLHQEPTGDYGVCYEVATDRGWSLPSSLLHVHSDGPGSGGPFTIQVALPTALNPLGALNTPIVAVRWFIVQYPGFPLPSGIGGLFVEAGSNDWHYITAGDGITPHTTDDTLTQKLHFLADGSITDLELPLPVLATAPTMLVGKDEVSGLPAFCPPPLSPIQLLTSLDQPTATIDTCVQMRCGVAANCTDHLVSLYANWSRWLSPLFALLGTLAAAAFLEELGALFVAEEATEATIAVWSKFKPLLQSVLSTLTGNLLPSPTTDQTNNIKKMLFCVLACEGGEVALTENVIRAWNTALAAYPDWAISSLQGELLQLLTQYTPLQDWLIASSTATATSACDLWTCP